MNSSKSLQMVLRGPITGKFLGLSSNGPELAADWPQCFSVRRSFINTNR